LARREPVITCGDWDTKKWCIVRRHFDSEQRHEDAKPLKALGINTSVTFCTKIDKLVGGKNRAGCYRPCFNYSAPNVMRSRKHIIPVDAAQLNAPTLKSTSRSDHLAKYSILSGVLVNGMYWGATAATQDPKPLQSIYGPNA
jgi:hypothetical protein